MPCFNFATTHAGSLDINKLILYFDGESISGVFEMTLEQCKTCKYFRKLENGAVHCAHDKNLVVYASVYNPKLEQYVILNCPEER